ncbi:outer membrane immunogenic protein [Devosia lucknowensis]|uniref:Outer membrane immunogenic protein n=1 Tax=Devosia lucknowensis TaxID=1096929 RepID=A0A1Y6FLP6_9HYPH|nr:outer membrane protein [Devosia lucknowensis]SMQ75689.1 outer membrane immunogenic protein [Devosia lucknowensis]
MKHSLLALSALLLAAASAQAADLNWANNNATSPMYSPTSAAQWTGFYAGVSGGYGWGTTGITPANPGGQVNNNSGGWTLGGQAGYNVDMGGFVLGGEADLQWANIGYSEPIGGGTFTAKTDMFGTLRARAGVPVGQVMPYATLGVAYGRGSATVDTGVTTTQTANHFGWTAGVGLEAQATNNLSFKAEYLYVDLGSQAYNGLGIGARDVTQRFSVVRAGVNYKF